MRRAHRISVYKWLFLLVLTVSSVLILRRNTSQGTFQTYQGVVFGTTFHISYRHDTLLNDSIDQTLQQVDASLSMFNAQSTLSAINNNTSDKTDSLFRSVFRVAQEVSGETDGSFDITVAPLVNLWGFGLKNKEDVTAHQVDSIRHFVGYKLISLDEDRIVKNDLRTQLDCSAIAKGFGVDQIARLMDRNNVSDYMIEIGGEIAIKGKNKENTCWSIGINKPVEDSLQNNRELQTIIRISDVAMATSGNYRRFYYKSDGRKYAHTIDPHTGYPVTHTLLSATVFAPTCATADAYATAFMVMGAEKAKAVLSKHPELMAYLIISDKGKTYKVWLSPGLESHIEK